MQNFEPLISGKFYHIYNRGINSCDLFRKDVNYEHFLMLYERFISPVADTYAWCLMKNHFHLLVRVKEDVVYRLSNADRSLDPVRFENEKWETVNLSASTAGRPDSVDPERSSDSNNPNGIIKSTDQPKLPKPHLHFSHLFNAYSKYYNKREDRHGSLFERPFKRKLIENETYLKHVILYIHNNPVHHGFCTHPAEYPWSSYLSCISATPTKLNRGEVIGWFDDEANFKFMHNVEIEIEKLEKWLEI